MIPRRYISGRVKNQTNPVNHDTLLFTYVIHTKTFAVFWWPNSQASERITRKDTGSKPARRNSFRYCAFLANVVRHR